MERREGKRVAIPGLLFRFSPIDVNVHESYTYLFWGGDEEGCSSDLVKAMNRLARISLATTYVLQWTFDLCILSDVRQSKNFHTYFNYVRSNTVHFRYGGTSKVDLRSYSITIHTQREAELFWNPPSAVVFHCLKRHSEWCVRTCTST